MILRKKGVLLCSLGLLSAIGCACGTEESLPKGPVSSEVFTNAMQKRSYEDERKVDFSWVGGSSRLIDFRSQVGPTNGGIGG